MSERTYRVFITRTEVSHCIIEVTERSVASATARVQKHLDGGRARVQQTRPARLSPRVVLHSEIPFAVGNGFRYSFGYASPSHFPLPDR